MYDILELYEKPYDPKYPVIGLDEKPKQLLEDKRKAIPMKPGHIEKYDNQYIRRGNVNIFMAVEFKAGKRTTRVTSRRTKRDFAKFVKHLVDRVYPNAECVQLVLDNLNTHNESSFYEMYGSEEAEHILSKIEFHYTPVHASWLNVAEIEIGVMDTECTRRRIHEKEILRQEVMAWERRRNKNRCKIDWKFTRTKADKKLSAYYV
jgi:DDE superfamily endonuclease